MRKKRESRFKITLKENGIHSFQQGLKAYQRYRSHKEITNLKDAIMSLHHGVELLLKEILVQHSEFLIFENLKKVTRKQKHADQQGVGIFYIDHPPRTVSFIGALDRVDAFVTPDNLDGELISLLKELNRYRNQLEHYAIDANIDDVSKLIAQLQKPLLSLLESELGINTELRSIETKRAWSEANKDRLHSEKLETEIKDLLLGFSREKLPGRLFTRSRVVQLPVFNEVRAGYKLDQWPIQRIDLFAISDDEKWAIEIKRSLGRGRTGLSTVQSIKNLANLSNAIPWIIVGTSASDNLRSICREHNVMLSDREDLEEIKKRMGQRGLFDSL
jgi:hypothetical protein